MERLALSRPAPWHIFVVGAAAIACNAQPSGGASPPGGERDAVLARVGDVALTEGDLKRAIAREPQESRLRYNDEGARRRLLEGLVRFEILAEAAKGSGWLDEPEVVRAWKQQGVQKFIQARIGEATAAESISHQDVQDFYEANKQARFTQPEAVHLKQIVLPNERVAQEVLRQARELPAQDDRAFAELARAKSLDAVTGQRGGDLGFLSMVSPATDPILTAAAGLRQPGEICGPIETPKGWTILRLVAKRSAVIQPLEDVETNIRQALQRQRREAALDALIADLRKKAKVTYTGGPTAPK